MFVSKYIITFLSEQPDFIELTEETIDEPVQDPNIYFGVDDKINPILMVNKISGFFSSRINRPNKKSRSRNFVTVRVFFFIISRSRIFMSRVL
jgi:hypothetical protein